VEEFETKRTEETGPKQGPEKKQQRKRTPKPKDKPGSRKGEGKKSTGKKGRKRGKNKGDGKVPIEKPPKTAREAVKRASAEARKALPEIVKAVVRKAKTGSVAHAKMVLQETGMDRMLERETQREAEQSLTDILLEKLGGTDQNQARKKEEESDG